MTVIRQYPPWAVVSALATLIFASGGLYWKIDSIAQGQQSISQSVAEINKKIEVTNLTDAKHDLKLEDLDKRVTKLEAAR